MMRQRIIENRLKFAKTMLTAIKDKDIKCTDNDMILELMSELFITKREAREVLELAKFQMNNVK